jgi:hypothetical protein
MQWAAIFGAAFTLVFFAVTKRLVRNRARDSGGVTTGHRVKVDYRAITTGDITNNLEQGDPAERSRAPVLILPARTPDNDRSLNCSGARPMDDWDADRIRAMAESLRRRRRYGR